MFPQFSTFQKSIHLPENPALGASHPGNCIRSEFYAEHYRSMWFFHHPKQLLRQCLVRETPITYIFTPDMTEHALIHSDLHLHLPKIVCKDGYEARWVPNIGSTYILDAKLLIDGKVVQHFDRVWDDIDIALHPSDISENLGMVPSLQEWNSKLPEYDCDISLPWFYNQEISRHLPFYLCGTENHISHQITIRAIPADLLKCRLVVENRLVPIAEAIEGFQWEIDPIMWGDYLHFSDLELKYRRLGPERFNLIQYTDVLPIVVNVDLHHQTEIKIPILATHPIHGLIWCAENLESIASGWEGNYTTNSLCPGDGLNPIEATSLTSSSVSVFENLPGWRTERIYSQAFKPQHPPHGINCWYMGVYASSLNPPPGITFTSQHPGMLTIKFRAPEGEMSSNYRCYVYLLFTRQLTFTTFPKSDEERDGFKSNIQLEGENDP